MKKNRKSGASSEDDQRPSKNKRTMAKDKPRLDMIRQKTSGEIADRDDLLDSPDADMRAQQLQNLIERHKIDQASRVFSKEKAQKKKIKFAEIKRKIDDGFYDNPNQLADLAEKLIRRFGLE